MRWRSPTLLRGVLSYSVPRCQIGMPRAIAAQAKPICAGAPSCRYLATVVLDICKVLAACRSLKSTCFSHAQNSSAGMAARRGLLAVFSVSCRSGSSKARVSTRSPPPKSLHCECRVQVAINYAGLHYATWRYRFPTTEAFAWTRQKGQCPRYPGRGPDARPPGP